MPEMEKPEDNEMSSGTNSDLYQVFSGIWIPYWSVNVYVTV